MEPVDKVMQNAEREIVRSSKTSPTAAGHRENIPPEGGDNSEQLIDTINQVFSLFRINYHNQFYAAYSDNETLNQAKRMWLQSLKHLDVATILNAAKKLIESSEYLPTLHRFLSLCDAFAYDLPDARDAYLEACSATEPREAYAWSHPVVYHAGKATGWFFLRSHPESQTFPAFKKQFDLLAEKIRLGETLTLPAYTALQNKRVEPLNQKEQKNRLAELRKQLALDE